MPTFNPLDPFGSIGAMLWYVVVQLHTFTYNGLNDPTSMLGTSGYAKWLFEENWGLVSYLLSNFIVVLIGAVALGWTRGSRYVPKALLFAIVIGMAGGTLFWNANMTILKWSAGASHDLSGLSLGQAAAVVSSAVPIQPLEGPLQAVYVFDIFFAAIQAVLLVVIVLSQFMVSWLFIATVACYPLGETGKMIGRIGFAAWFISIVLAMPTMAFLRRISVVVSYGQTEPWVRITNYGFILLMVLAFSVYILVVNVGLTRIEGGRLDAEVNGFVKADVEGGNGSGAGGGSSADGSGTAQPLVPSDSGTQVTLDDQAGSGTGEVSSEGGELVESPGSITVDGLTIDTSGSTDSSDGAETDSRLPSPESDETYVTGSEPYAQVDEWRKLSEEVTDNEDAPTDEVRDQGSNQS